MRAPKGLIAISLDAGLRPQFVQDLIGSSKTVEPKCYQISHRYLAVSSSCKVMLKVLM